MKYKLLLLLFPFILNGQISNWDGKTAEQLANITTGTTKITKDYFVDNAYTQIYDILNFLIEPTINDITDGDTTPDISNAVIHKMSNTSLDTITTFDGTPPFNLGIRILVDTDSVVFKNSSTFDLGGVDLCPQDGDILYFVKDTDDSKWYGWFENLE